MTFAFRLKSALASTTLVLAAALAPPALAAVLYSNPWVDTPYGVQADVYAGGYTAASVPLGGPVEISSISWWGTYGIAGSTADDLFTVSFNGNALVGTVTPVNASAANVPAFKYTLLLDSMLLFTGGAVDIGIVNGAGDVELEWFWLDAGTDPGSLPADFLPSSLVIEGERQATPVPEPGTWALFASAGGLLLALRRRRTAHGD